MNLLFYLTLWSSRYPSSRLLFSLLAVLMIATINVWYFALSCFFFHLDPIFCSPPYSPGFIIPNNHHVIDTYKRSDKVRSYVIILELIFQQISRWISHRILYLWTWGPHPYISLPTSPCHQIHIIYISIGLNVCSTELYRGAFWSYV